MERLNEWVFQNKSKPMEKNNIQNEIHLYAFFKNGLGYTI